MKPLKFQAYRSLPKQRQIIDEEVEKILKIDAIEPYSSNFSSPVILVPKSYDEQGKVTHYRMVCVLRGLK